ncbi:1,4-alpha-glucan branching protein domain-containing protein [Treponema endosymbiont of Eucomonympha sp.]|uniref:1,4-alpha-glucan branching protein domain-containing protein n=1 Tax=Treponema endosymbiont of Eucomonympha sp. TaxID=1580831 RepID=UPI0007836F29|nr:1,4-alpha-glucan branching protein domain-containing protein [Treponema endosymbiont of Eucomonympha sp.]
MPKKNLTLTIVAHEGYIRHEEDAEKYAPQQAGIFTAISETYLPLLKLFAALEKDGVPFHLNMVFSPTLCALLTDSLVQTQYLGWLDKNSAFGERELSRFGTGDKRRALAESCLTKANEDRRLFADEYGGDILAGFKRFAERGYIELMATAATYAFLPHYADLPKTLCAQVEVGLLSHKTYFSAKPEGFWLPYMGYAAGIERLLRTYDMNYTIADSHAALLGKPLAQRGVFSPVRCANELAVFARAYEGAAGGSASLPQRGVYRNQRRDATFEENAGEPFGFVGEVGARIPSLYKYRPQSDRHACYDPAAAEAQAKKDAEAFLAEKIKLLGEAEQAGAGTDLSLAYAFRAQFFGAEWHEGIGWLEQVLRLSGSEYPGLLTQNVALLDNQSSLQKIALYPSAFVSADTFLDNSNAHLLRYARKAGERMTELARRFSCTDGISFSALNVAAAHTLLAQASDWPKMLHDRLFPGYATERFAASVAALTTVFDSLGSRGVSPEWLVQAEKKHTLFPWIHYRVFGREK